MGETGGWCKKSKGEEEKGEKVAEAVGAGNDVGCQMGVEGGEGVPYLGDGEGGHGKSGSEGRDGHEESDNGISCKTFHTPYVHALRCSRARE